MTYTQRLCADGRPEVAYRWWVAPVADRDEYVLRVCRYFFVPSDGALGVTCERSETLTEDGWMEYGRGEVLPGAPVMMSGRDSFPLEIRPSKWRDEIAREWEAILSPIFERAGLGGPDKR